MRTRITGIVLSVVLIAAGVVLLAGDAGPAPSPPGPIPLGSEAIYRLEVRVYLEPSYIVAAQSMNPETVSRIIAMLETLDPPADLIDTHQQVLDGYRYIRDGRQILFTAPRSDGTRRAEGEFLVSWGVSRLFEAARQLDEQ